MICPTCPLTNAAGHFVYWFHFFTPQCGVCVCCTCRLGLQSFTLTRVSHWSQRMQGGAHVRCAVPQANNGFAGDKSSPAALVRTTKWPEKNEKEKESMFLRNPREVKNEHIVMLQLYACRKLNFMSVLARALKCIQVQHSVAVLIAPSLFWIQRMFASPSTFQTVTLSIQSTWLMLQL